MKLDHGAWVVVADGRKFLVLENRGDAGLPDLRVRAMREVESPRTSESGTGPPGRFSGPGGRREAAEQTDWHRRDEAAFAAGVAEMIDTAAREGATRRLVLVADARSLGEIRSHLTPAARALVVREIVGDWTRHTVAGIEEAIARA